MQQCTYVYIPKHSHFLHTFPPHKRSQLPNNARMYIHRNSTHIYSCSYEGVLCLPYRNIRPVHKSTTRFRSKFTKSTTMFRSKSTSPPPCLGQSPLCKVHKSTTMLRSKSTSPPPCLGQSPPCKVHKSTTMFRSKSTSPPPCLGQSPPCKVHKSTTMFRSKSTMQSPQVHHHV